MALKYIIFSLLIIAVKSTPTKAPKVYEIENDTSLKENVRVPRNPKLNHFPIPPNFDYRKATQQDPQRIRYAQQQQVDSYMRAYQQEQATKSPQKHRKIERVPPTPDQFAKTTYDNRVKSENRQPAPKQLTVINNQHPKKVDPVQLKAVDNSPQEFINGLKKSVTSQKKINPQLGYMVSEDLEVEPSSKHESRVYFGQEEILKTVQTVQTPLSPNYLAKPSYVIANPQLNQLILDPKLLADGATYALPANHQLSQAGFEPASKTDLEALNSLLRQSPNAQPHGLNELINHQQTYASSAPSIPLPEAQPSNQQLSHAGFEPASKIDLEALNSLLRQSPNAQPHGLHELINHQQTYASSAPSIPLPEAQPSNHQLSHAGFEPEPKIDLEALSSLLGQSPNTQLQGFNEFINHQQTYAPSAVPIPLPEAPQFVLKDVEIQPQAVVGVKDHTPINEEIIDVANTQTKPNINTQASISESPINTYNTVREAKSIYGDQDDNLQYAAQYAFGYKIRDYHSGSNFGHEEIREGEVAKGHYHVLLPDGRLQNVEYWADPSGYHATVTYTNLAQH